MLGEVDGVSLHQFQIRLRHTNINVFVFYLNRLYLLLIFHITFQRYVMNINDNFSFFFFDRYDINDILSK